MKARKTLFHAVVAGALLLGGLAPVAALAQDSSAPAPDNTKVNRRDRKKSEVTADQQKMDKADRTITRNVRKAIMKDKSLSTYAHNIKIISRDGMVTLKGPVRSEDEKKAIEEKAAEVAGSSDKVHSEISVTP